MKKKTKQTSSDFQTVWKRRKQHWKEKAEETLPDDATLLHLAELARQRAEQQTHVVVPFVPRRKRWMPYAAAASLLIGVAAFGWARYGRADDGRPMAEEVSVEGQTVHFLCNSGCSAQDVLFAVGDVIK